MPASPANANEANPARAEGRLSRWLGRLEDTFLVVLLVGLVLLAATQIILRNGFGTGLIWSDELLRLMVLWVALIGAVAASRDNRHINIDVFSRALPAPAQRLVRVINAAFTSAVCGLLAWHAGRFVRDAATYGDTLLGGLPAWPFQVILPLGFGLVALRYLAHTWRAVRGVD